MSTRGNGVDELVDLRDDDAALERGRLDDGRRVLGVRAGVEVAVGDPPLAPRPARRAASGRRSSGRTARGRCGSRRWRSGRRASQAGQARRLAARRTRSRAGSRRRARRRRDARAAPAPTAPCAGRAPRRDRARASALARKSACFWLLPSRQTRSPGFQHALEQGARIRSRHDLSCAERRGAREARLAVAGQGVPIAHPFLPLRSLAVMHAQLKCASLRTNPLERNRFIYTLAEHASVLYTQMRRRGVGAYSGRISTMDGMACRRALRRCSMGRTSR